MGYKTILRGLMIFLALSLIACETSNSGSSPVVKTESASSDSGSGKPIYISNNIPYKKGTFVPAAVRTECALGIKLADSIDDYGDTYDKNIVPTNNLKAKKKGRVLKMEIIDLLGRAGGAYSGYKYVTVKGTLKENGKVIGTFRAKRYSGGGFWGGFKGTCAILGRCTNAIAKDIVLWLENPVKGARLGDN